MKVINSAMLDSELAERIRIKAFQDRVSKSEVIRKAIERYLENV